MNHFEPVLNWLHSRNIELNRREMSLIRQYTILRTAKAKEILMAQDETVHKFYFLNSGIVRLFRIEEGNDHTLGLVNSRDFLSAPQLVFSNWISTCGLETLTDAELLEWDSNALHTIKKYAPELYKIELAQMMRLLDWVQQNQIEMICFPAEKRYQLLLERQPEVLLNIPLKYIASFLGIHTDSLSRIRKTHQAEGARRSRPRD